MTMTTHPRYPRRVQTRRRFGALAVGLVASLTLGSCWRYSTDQNTVVAGNIAYVFFKKKATDQVVDGLHYGYHHGDERATLTDMLHWVKSRTITGKLAEVGFALSDFDYFFDPDNDDDFGEAAARTRGRTRCLDMHRNLSPWGDRHNWTYREDADRYCVQGLGY